MQMAMTLESFMQMQIGANTGRDFLMALGALVCALIILKIFREIVLHRLMKLADKTKTDLDDVLIDIVHDIKPPFYILVSIYISIKFLALPALAWSIIDGVFILAVVYQAVRALQKFIDYWTSKLVSRQEDGDLARNKAAVKSLSSIFKIVVWLFAIMIILANWGFNVTSLIAGLGIGGIAIAFALQNILGDIFSSFSIIIDKPFQIGDFIIVGTDMGTVEKIGIKTTRIKTLQGEELVISNSELTNTRVHNYKKMEKRRISFAFGVLYETPSEKMKKIPDIVKSIIEKETVADFDRAHFKDFGDFSLNYEVVYYVTVPDYTVYMNIQESINLALKAAFEEEGIEFAYPTQTLFVKK